MRFTICNYEAENNKAKATTTMGTATTITSAATTIVIKQ